MKEQVVGVKSQTACVDEKGASLVCFSSFVLCVCVEKWTMFIHLHHVHSSCSFKCLVFLDVFFYKIYKCVHTAECVRVVKMILILLNFK